MIQQDLDLNTNGDSHSNVDNSLDQESGAEPVRPELEYLPVHELVPDPDQPRLHFDEEELRELADSIKLHGVRMPVEFDRRDGQKVIIDGERRWRAAGLAGIDLIPTVDRSSDDLDGAERIVIQLVLNMQRSNLHYSELAPVIHDLVANKVRTVRVLAQQLGKSHGLISQLNSIGKVLNELEDDVRTEASASITHKAMYDLVKKRSVEEGVKAVEGKLGQLNAPEPVVPAEQETADAPERSASSGSVWRATLEAKVTVTELVEKIVEWYGEPGEQHLRELAEELQA